MASAIPWFRSRSANGCFRWQTSRSVSCGFPRAPTPISLSTVRALTTAVRGMIDASLQHGHLVFIYFVPTALIAIRYGSVSAMCVTIAATFAAAYFFYAPLFSFKVESQLDILELILFSLLALL